MSAGLSLATFAQLRDPLGKGTLDHGVVEVQFTPAQMDMSDGCHLDRSTLRTIRRAGFCGGVDAECFELENFIKPTVAAFALA